MVNFTSNIDNINYVNGYLPDLYKKDRESVMKQKLDADMLEKDSNPLGKKIISSRNFMFKPFKEGEKTVSFQQIPEQV